MAAALCLGNRILLHSSVGFQRRLCSVKQATRSRSDVVERMRRWMKAYEDFVGITSVKEAQAAVIQAEKLFLVKQEHRREKQLYLQTVQTAIKDIRSDIDKVPRGDDRYLDLLTIEHNKIKEEKLAVSEYEALEKEEREHFISLSGALKGSQRQEQQYSEKTKYWSIIGSVCGITIGVLGATINNYVRQRKLRKIVRDASNANLHDLLVGLSATMEGSQEGMKEISADVDDMMSKLNEHNANNSEQNDCIANLKKQLNDILNDVQKNELVLQKDMQSIKTSIEQSTSMSLASTGDDVLYIGPNVKDMLDESTQRIMDKLNASQTAVNAAVFSWLAFVVIISLVKLAKGA
ncbi:PREDICTED: coiled-coil domain-containing protein 51-like [Priapulus caudatus]|uniref:Coiled-coil domain-containing protein 51-like n=1 Tax=Priapulus caudatus TaxID=37621 RepID=A0ABM1E743_PRICU|nr:PREDICTED: coiled-coil domain-containing protein 51-like [Priapulus caudatus]